MPDGDKVHALLALRYQKHYKQICEGFMSADEIGHDILNPLKEEIRNLSNEEVITLIKKVAARCNQIVVELRFDSPIIWEKEAQLIEQYAQYAYMKKAAKNLLLEACKEQLRDIRHDGFNLNMEVEIMKKYMLKIYESQFAEKVLKKRKHENNVDPDFVRERLHGMQDQIWLGLCEFARQAIQNGNFKSLRRPSRRRHKFSESDLHDDITKLLA